MPSLYPSRRSDSNSSRSLHALGRLPARAETPTQTSPTSVSPPQPITPTAHLASGGQVGCRPHRREPPSTNRCEVLWHHRAMRHTGPQRRIHAWSLWPAWYGRLSGKCTTLQRPCQPVLNAVRLTIWPGGRARSSSIIVIPRAPCVITGTHPPPAWHYPMTATAPGWGAPAAARPGSTQARGQGT